MEVLWDIYKQQFKEDPLFTYFESGISKYGYCNYRQMVVKFQDTVDVLKFLHPYHEFIFFFDRSDGHVKKIVCGLDIPSQ